MPPKTVPFGRYTLTGLLGRGGMATVYRAMMAGPMGFQKEVAVKRIHPEVTADRKRVQALVNEARLGGQLRHKNIVEIYEFDELGDTYFMAMEFIDGWSLDHVLRHCRRSRTPVPVSVVHEIMTEVCRGLHHAHTLVSHDGREAKLIHRDLKPGNLMIGRDGSVKVMDFGVAKATTNLYQTTAADTIKGTPVYMSPEQVRAMPMDCRSDLFSLGSILAELATGRIAFLADNLITVTWLIVECDIAELLEVVEDRHPPLGAVVARCMAVEPDDRYATARDMEKALRASWKSAPTRPTLAEWLGEIHLALPSAPPTGDFGSVGPPEAVEHASADGPQTTFSGVSKAPVPGLYDTTELPPELLPSYTGPDAPAPDRDATDAVEAAAPDGFDRFDEPDEPDEPDELSVGAPALALLAAGALVLAVIAGVLVTVEEPAPETPAAAETHAVLSRPEVAEPEPMGSDAEPITFEPTPALTPEPVAEATPTPAPRPAAAAPSQPRSQPAPTPERAPAPVPEPPPASAVQVPVVINTTPWSNVFIDGKSAGRTLLRTELSAGTHEVRLVCQVCEPDVEETHSFEVVEGARNKLIRSFDAP